MSDEDDFRELVGDDVQPLTVEKRVAIAADSKVDKAWRREAASEQVQTDSDPLSSSAVEMVDPLAVLSFQRTGVQHGVFKNLRLAKYTIDARLDLHRLSAEQARTAVYQFISDCMQNDVRAALITHGKGLGREHPALLKSCVAHWLPQMEQVLAFHSAQKRHGGAGATYVLIRKSERKKQETRDKIANNQAQSPKGIEPNRS